MKSSKNKNRETKESNDSEDPRRLAPTRSFILSYPHVFKPSAIKGSKDPKDLNFSFTMLIPKDADISEFKRAVFVAKKIEWGKNKDEWPENLQSPIKDGDKPIYAGKEGYKGHYAIKVSTKASRYPDGTHPEVYGIDAKPLKIASELYPGCEARACIFALTWEYADKAGVKFVFDSIQKLGEGKAFGGRKPASQVYTPVDRDEDLDDDNDNDDDDDDDTESDEDDGEDFT